MAIQRPAGEFDFSYAYDMATIRRRWQWVMLLLFLAGLYTLPLYASRSVVSLVNRIGISIIAVQGLNLLTGYTGQISIGQAAFMTAGGYISALLVNNLGWPFPAALPVAALGAGLVGLIFGLPSLRVKGFYLTMATLAAQFIIPWFTRQAFPEVLNGAQGLNVNVPVIFGIEFNEPGKYIYLTLTTLIITTVIAHNISRSRLGRAFVAIRDNDLAAELLGVNLFKYKLQAFFLAAVYAGVAGSLMAHHLRHINSETFNLVDSVLLLGMLVVGGLGTNLGAIVGAIVVEFIIEGATLSAPFFVELFPATAAGMIQALRPLFFGVTLMLFLIFEPRGLAHRWQLFKAAWRLRPFSH
ncbi:MAG: branched-chain amino acid ABC transporter permease [Anaerolineales bacterium]|nr:branched-chain amino acid ABC transporter permease [Anaerolineales bacterium]